MDRAEIDSVLRAVLRFSLSATSRTSFPHEKSVWPITASSSKSQDPGFRRLLDGILFSRRFTLTYLYVLLGILATFSLFHWFRKLRRWRRRNSSMTPTKGASLDQSKKSGKSSDPGDGRSDGNISDEDDEESSSTSSSTLRGTASPPLRDYSTVSADESSPLLVQPSTGTTPRYSNMSSCVRAWLMYQPRPIPLIGKALPSNAISMTVVSFVTLNIFYCVYGIPFTIPTLFLFADRTALMFVVNLPPLYLFAAKNQPIKLLTGYSYESLNVVHRRLGEIMCLLALLHSVGMLGVWYTLLHPIGVSFVSFALKKIILLGFGAFVSYEALYLSSLASFRQIWYELFLGLHVVLQSVALVFLWFHHRNSRPYVGAALGIWVIDRILFRLALKTRQLRATLEIMHDQSTVSLRVKTPISNGTSRVGSLLVADLAGGWKPSEHIFVTIPALAPKHIIQAHPFTIACLCSPSDSEAEVRLLVRAQDGFSKDLVTYAKNHKSVDVRLDGPYGSRAGYELLKDSNLAVLVAGGSGIAVIWPLIQAMKKNSIALEGDIESCSNAKRTILFVWVVHQQSHLSWIGESDLKALAANGVDVVIPKPTAEYGRPDVGIIVKNWIGEHNLSGSKAGVVCSGPDGLNRTVRNTCSAMVAAGWDISVEVEKFGW